MDSEFEVTFLGTNGSCAYNAGNRQKYGTNTLCVAVKAGSETIIFDAGSGICGFRELADYQNERAHVFFSHHHIDHFSGLLFFAQLFDKQKQFDFYGSGSGEKDFRGVVDGYLCAPLSPIGIEGFTAKIEFHTLTAGQTVALESGVIVRTHLLAHPGGSIGYRVEYGGKAFCYCTDIELASHQNDAVFLEFTRSAELLVLDAFFPDAVIPGWGHSNWRECAEWANRVGVKKLALFHYGFALSDSDIDALEAKAKSVFSGAFASADRMRVIL